MTLTNYEKDCGQKSVVHFVSDEHISGCGYILWILADLIGISKFKVVGGSTSSSPPVWACLKLNRTSKLCLSKDI